MRKAALVFTAAVGSLVFGLTGAFCGAEAAPGVTAKVVKIVNNMMSMGNVLVAAEAFALGVAAGVEPDKLYDVLSVSGGRSHHFTNNKITGIISMMHKNAPSVRLSRVISSCVRRIPRSNGR